MSTDPVRWGILGPGRIARAFAAGLREAEGAVLAAVGSRDLDRARGFAADFDAARAHGSYEDLVADPEVDAIYVATPHAFHEAQAILGLEAGKHVLCEKPLALNAAQARRMIATARACDRVLMEAMWTRFLPVWTAIAEQVASGAIGDVRLIQADFGFRTTFDAASRLFAPQLGGGTLLNLGIYPLNLAFLLAGPPVEIHTTATLGTTGVDEEMAILLRHAEDRMSLLACSFRADTPREARIIGTDGHITVASPWWGGSRFVRCTKDGREESCEHPARGGGYTDEAEAFMAMIRSGRRESPVMPLAESAAILATMDTIRDRWGVRYPQE